MRVIIFDFDGTIAEVFNRDEYAAFSKIVSEMPEFYDISGWDRKNVLQNFDVLKNSSELDYIKKKKLIEFLNLTIELKELELIKKCRVCTDVVESIFEIAGKGKEIAVLSNNSEKSLLHFFEQHQIRDLIHVIGRDSNNQVDLKPSIQSLKKIQNHFDFEPCDMLFVGDSKVDYICAERLQCEFIAMDRNHARENYWKKIDKNIIVVNSFQELKMKIKLCG